MYLRCLSIIELKCWVSLLKGVANANRISLVSPRSFRFAVKRRSEDDPGAGAGFLTRSDKSLSGHWKMVEELPADAPCNSAIGPFYGRHFDLSHCRTRRRRGQNKINHGWIFFVKQLRLRGALTSFMPAHCHTAVAYGDTRIEQSRRKCCW